MTIPKCPACGAPLFKDIVLEGSAAGAFGFKGRCAGCKAPFTFRIETELVAVIFVNGDRQISEDASTDGASARLL